MISYTPRLAQRTFQLRTVRRKPRSMKKLGTKRVSSAMRDWDPAKSRYMEVVSSLRSQGRGSSFRLETVSTSLISSPSETSCSVKLQS